MSQIQNSHDSLPTQLMLWQGDQRPATAVINKVSCPPAPAIPWGSLTELPYSTGGGELQGILPELARISQAGRWLALIAPPHLPLAPSLAASGLDLSRILLVHARPGGDGLALVERALRAGTCGAVLAWPTALDDTALGRLRAAAAASRAWCLLFRPEGGVRPTPSFTPPREGMGLRPAHGLARH